MPFLVHLHGGMSIVYYLSKVSRGLKCRATELSSYQLVVRSGFFNLISVINSFSKINYPTHGI